MKLNLTPHHADITYHIIYKEPYFKVVFPDYRINFLKAVIDKWRIRLNDFVYNDKLLSNEMIRFSKFIGQTLIDVSFGAEEATIKLNRPTDERQLIDIMLFFQKLLDGFEFNTQRILIQRHLESTEKVDDYLSCFSSNVPESFKDKMVGQGFIYSLLASEYNLNIQFFFAKSVIVENGLFFSTDFVFSPNNFNIENAINIAKNQYNEILKGLDLVIIEG